MHGFSEAQKIFALGFLAIPFKNAEDGLKTVMGQRKGKLTTPKILLEDFKKQKGCEPDGWAAVCGFTNEKNETLIYLDAEKTEVADTIREKIKIVYGEKYREEFGSKGAHFPLIIDEELEKRIQFFINQTNNAENLALEVLTDWLCVLPNSIHRKTGKKYQTIHEGEIPKIKKEELLSFLQNIAEEQNLFTGKLQKKENKIKIPDEDAQKIKTKVNFFSLGFKSGLQPCPLSGHKHNDEHPSFSVSSDGSVANCFSVHNGMDIFTYFMLRDNIDFPTAKERILQTYFTTDEKLKLEKIKNSDGKTWEENNKNSVEKWENGKVNAINAKRNCINLFLDGELIVNAINARVNEVSAGNAPPPGGGCALLHIHKFLHEQQNNITEWLIPQFVPKSTICMLAAKRASMKTFMALYFGLSVANGKETVLGKSAQSSVLYLDYENGEFELSRRLLGLHDAECQNNNFVLSIFPPIRLDAPNGVELLISAIEAVGAKLVIIDTMRRLSSSDENASETSNAILDGLQRVIIATGCSFLLLHHMRKSSTNGKTVEEDVMDEIRGSSDIPASCAVIYYLKRQGVSDKFILKQLKNRFGIERRSLQLHIEGHAPDKITIVSDGEIDDAAFAEGTLVNQIWEWLIRERKFQFETSELHTMFIGAPPDKYSKRSVDDAIAILKANNKIERDGKRGHYRMILEKKQENLLKEHDAL